MPLPNPKKDEKKNDFMSRCMSDETMKKDFKDNKQRVAVCIAQFSKKDSKANWVNKAYNGEMDEESPMHEEMETEEIETQENQMEESQMEEGQMEDGGEEEDYEGEMAKIQLMKIADNAMQIARMIKSEDQQLEAWVQDKISVSEHHMQAVRDYMKYGQ
jgi:hypothetical protein